MSMRISTAWRNQAADAASQIDNGSGTAKLQLRSGSPPTNLTDAAAGTLLAEFDLPNPSFGEPSNGTATANSITAVEGLAAGTVGHFRVLDRDGDPVEDSDSVGTSGQVELTLNTLTISEGVDVTVTSWTVSMPES